MNTRRLHCRRRRGRGGDDPSAVELLRDTQARWTLLRRERESSAFDAARDPAIAQAIAAPPVDVCAIDVSFDALSDKSEVVGTKFFNDPDLN